MTSDHDYPVKNVISKHHEWHKCHDRQTRTLLVLTTLMNNQDLPSIRRSTRIVQGCSAEMVYGRRSRSAGNELCESMTVHSFKCKRYLASLMINR
jgi:hypothetical protein